jgi:VWFA-related protein
MSYLPQFPFARWGTCLSLLLLLGASSSPLRAQSSPPPPPTTQEAPPAQTPAAPSATDAPKTQAQNSADNTEVSSRDTAPTFKVRVNLVLVRVVVRDAKGHVVPDLHKEDFQLFDRGKPQVISSFSVETPESHVVATTTSSSPDAPSEALEPGRPVASLPTRFVSVVFDDQHLSMNDAVFVRDQAGKFFNSLAPSDRVGVFSTSGQVTQDFTDDHELLKKSLLQILPRSPTQGMHMCPDINYYEADLIVNKQDVQALGVATEDTVQCAFNGDESQQAAARSIAQGAASGVLSAEDASTEYALRHMEEVMRRLSGKPGQRVMVFISPGFLTTTLQIEFSDLVDRATKANIVVNTIDARGLYTPDNAGDISDPPQDSPRVAGYKATYRVEAQVAQEDVLAQFADGTGGTFFHNRNDLDEGMREAGAAPALTYLLGFSPQNLKLDGSLHLLKVTFVHKTNYKIQARHGYYAPRHVVDPVEQAKQEIQEALFSQDEMSDLPVDLHTQFFKTATDAKLAVLTHVDLKGVHFRKAEGRNRDNLTVATAIFDENGNYVIGGEKIIEMKLLDTTYDRLSHSGLNLKSSFDVKPGTYLVRQVVRDSEGAQIAARNGAVVIPN